jgi:hypothetical protein
MGPSVRTHGTIESAIWPLRKAAWKIEDSVIWPVADAIRGRRRPDLHFRIPTPEVASQPEAIGAPEATAGFEAVETPARLGLFFRRDVRVALATMAIAAGAGVAVAVVAGTFGGKHPEASAPAVAQGAVDTPPPSSIGSLPAATKSRTLEGVTPEFKSSPKSAATGSDAGAATATPVSPLQGTNAKPSRIPPGSANEAAALHTARDFAGAFVLYEIGQSNAKVRKTFARTATPALAKALRDRPPRLPGSGKVPKARVQNVVLGARDGRQVAASASLLRLGNLSELRLTLTQRHKIWAVSEVRG